MFTYRTYAQLADDVRDWLAHAGEFSAVAGIPRSGVIPAAIVAQERAIPLLELTTLTAPYRPEWSRRLQRPGAQVLILDDTAWTGRTINAWRLYLAAADKPLESLTFAAVYAGPRALPQLDAHGYRLETSAHSFAWNIGRDVTAHRLATDLDGVLCHDPPHQVTPRLAPAQFHTIITGRRERHRAPTLRWLQAHGVRFRRLVMRPDDVPDAHVPRFKASVYKRIHDAGDVVGYLESDDRQAREIADRTRLPVVSVQAAATYHTTPARPSWTPPA